MEIKYQISSREYIKLMFFLTYRKIVFILMLIMGLYFIYQTINILATDKIYYLQRSIGNIVIILLIFVVYPLLLYFRFKRAYKTNKIISDQVTTLFNHESLKDISNSFTAEVNWSSIYKVEELNNWFLFYQNHVSFGFCPKRVMTKEQILELRNIIKSLGVKAKLKKD